MPRLQAWLSLPLLQACNSKCNQGYNRLNHDVFKNESAISINVSDTLEMLVGIDEPNFAGTSEFHDTSHTAQSVITSDLYISFK